MLYSEEKTLGNQKISGLTKDFDIMLGGNSVLPEEKGIHIMSCPRGRDVIEISFPRHGGEFGDIWSAYGEGALDGERLKEISQKLGEEITEEEKSKSASLTLILREEGVLEELSGVEYAIINAPIPEEAWQIEHGPKISIRIPLSHINVGKVKYLAEQRIKLEMAEELLLKLVRAVGLREERIRGYGVEGITLEYPCYVAGLSCELCSDSLDLLGALKESLQDAGLRLEELLHNVEGCAGAGGVYILRFEDPYDNDILDRLESAINTISKEESPEKLQ